MSKTTPAFHGSDIEKIEEFYHIPQEQILAFGSNVNPLGISNSLRSQLADHIDAITTYPDRDYKSLRTAIASYTGTTLEQIMVGNGSTELISLAMQTMQPKKACILGPTYSEYEREITIGGGVCFSYHLSAEDQFALHLDEFRTVLQDHVDLLVLCNPNNPTSSALSVEQLTLLLQLCRDLHIFVVIDETYVEFAEDMAAITAVPLVSQFDNLMILRGVSKFFASPGLRLGYALCSNQALYQQMEQRKNPWTINSLAVIAGELMFQDAEYMQQTRQLIQTERTRIYQRLLLNPHLRVFPPAANFILVQIADHSMTGKDFFEYAIRQGLMIRDCSTFESLGDYFFRFCFLMPEENDRLLACIEEAFPLAP